MIIPSILTDKISDFTEKLTLIDSFPDVSAIQVDFADGRFVPNKTLMPAVLPSLPLKYIFFAHLMVENPLSYLDDIEKSGFENAAIHFESFKSSQEAVEGLKTIAERGITPHLAINPSTSMEKVFAILPQVSNVWLMAVNPGFYGGKYIPEEVERVKFLRSRDFYGTITIDGGITVPRIADLLAAGADNFVVGSAIFKDKNPGRIYREFLSQLAQNL